MAESLPCSLETIRLLSGYTPTQNKNFFKKEEEKKENSEFTKLTGCGAVAINYFL